MAQEQEQEQERGEVHHRDLGLVAGGLLGMIEGLYAVPDSVLNETQTSKQIARDLIAVVLDGIRGPDHDM